MQFSRRFARNATVAILVIGSIGGCAKKKKNDESASVKMNVTASSLLISIPEASLANNLFADEYENMGINYGDAIIEGLKVKVHSISVSDTVPGKAGGGFNKNIVDWSASPKELEIADGVDAPITEVTELDMGDKETIELKSIGIEIECRYAVKAWAYLDGNNDGTIDTTIWTTKDAVKKSSSKLAKAEMSDYDYYEYGFGYLHCGKGGTKGPGSYADARADVKTTGISTILPEPVVLRAKEMPAPEEGAEPLPKTTEISLDVLIDSYRVVKVWNGDYGQHTKVDAGDGRVPYPMYPFPKADIDSRRSGEDGIKTTDAFEKDQPHFGLHYIPGFAFINTDGLKYETYLLSASETPNPLNSHLFTVILDKDRKPVMGSIGVNDDASALYLGQAARLFTAQDNGKFTFYTSYGMKDANGVHDGGLYYNNDKTMAGHAVEDFEPLGSVGDKGIAKLKDGPRCKDEYDTCVESADGWHKDGELATDTDGKKYRKVYFKRVGK